jgi:hypothetical protein
MHLFIPKYHMIGKELTLHAGQAPTMIISCGWTVIVVAPYVGA